MSPRVTVINASDIAELADKLKPTKKPRVEHDLTIHYLPEEELAYYPGNSRRGDEDKIDESIGENGFFAPLTVQKSTGYILIGNHRFKVGKERYGFTTFPCILVDVDDRAALKINLADNGSSDAATFDKEAHLELLRSLEGDYWGSTTDEDTVKALEAALNPDDEEDEGAGDLGVEPLVLCPNCAHEFNPTHHRITD